MNIGSQSYCFSPSYQVASKAQGCSLFAHLILSWETNKTVVGKYKSLNTLHHEADMDPSSVDRRHSQLALPNSSQLT